MSASRPVLALVPGLNNTAAVWDLVRERLPASIDAVALENPPLADVDSIAREHLAQLPPRFFLCGFSFGGYVAMAMCARAADRLRGLAMLAAGAGADSDAQRAVRRSSIARANAGEYEAMLDGIVGRVFHPSCLDDADLMARRRAMVAAYGPQRFVAHTQACIDRPDRGALFAALRVPLLVAGGDEDRVVPPAVLQGLVALNPAARFASLPATGHMAPLERPGEVAALLARWIEDSAQAQP